jgi:hypothetical protein
VRRPRSRLGRGLAVAALGSVAGFAGLLAVVGGRLGGSGGALAPPRYVDEAASAGIDHRYDGDFEYFVGGGVAVFDCDEDGRQELFLAGGSRPAALFRNESALGGPLRFERVPSEVTDLDAVTGAYPLDVDGDRLTDLAVLRLGEDVLLRGLGECRFERANESWGLEPANDWTAAFSAAWEGEAAWPTLAFGNYLTLTEDGVAGDECDDSRLIRPHAEGPAYRDSTPLAPGYCTLSVLFSDWDRSGRRDLRVSNDRHYAFDAQEQLWRIAPGEPPRAYTLEEGWQILRIWGMGIASHDVTGDGYPEYYLTSQANNKLQALVAGPAGPRYADIAFERHATAHEPYAGDTDLPSTAWHPEFRDVNNDGWIDLYVSKGNVEAMPDYAARDPSNLLVGQPDGTFVEGAEAAGIVGFARARGAALADLNLDGLLDLVEVNRRERVELWRNVGSGTADSPAPMGNWLSLRIDDPERLNHDAVGAWVEVRIGDRVMSREVTVGGGHAGGQLGRIHFGLGSAERAEVRVRWPDGEVGAWIPVDANRFWQLARGGLRAVEWRPSR